MLHKLFKLCVRKKVGEEQFLPFYTFLIYQYAFVAGGRKGKRKSKFGKNMSIIFSFFLFIFLCSIILQMSTYQV
ncbi:hypothetical protein HMPREF0083_02731 [Aneurinibacillus aneurinilyticus ATCC 12856]|uniref:Uncharacterized protein n=1 Tax=Aneurinibacillus aneurinilyticus ATCC 12856 TaxID=649747 RepID=U1YEL0_ANEAE|nr:hypothetical protein HMPREF0083_02731 [Aneurinibacillus aneurinilyticus ATCC 12856]